VTTETGIRRLVPAADIDDYVFEPCGYSMNGILDGGFITIHITPEQVRQQQQQFGSRVSVGFSVSCSGEGTTRLSFVAVLVQQ